MKEPFFNLSRGLLGCCIALLMSCTITEPVYVSDAVPNPIPPGTDIEFDVRELDPGRFHSSRDWEQYGPTVHLHRPMTEFELRRWIISVAYHFFGNEWAIARARLEFPDGQTTTVVTTVKEAEMVEVVPLSQMK